MTAAPYYETDAVTVLAGDCLDVMTTLADASVDAVVTDPPYGLEFMGKDWDAPWKSSSVGRGARVATERAAELTPRGRGHSTSGGAYLASGVDSVRVAGRPFQEWCETWARECLRVLKPGGHILAFGGSRTWHRLQCAIEDAGFEIRDSIAWLYGSGFPKSLDVSKAIDKAAGAEREVIGSKLDRPGYHLHGHASGTGAFGAGLSSTTRETRLASSEITAPATSDAERWQGWGTALKPAFEPIVVGRKPLDGTVASNVLTHGTGALNIDACRTEYLSPTDKASARPQGAATSMSGHLAGKAQSCETPGSTEPSTTARTRESSANSTPTEPAGTVIGSPRNQFTPTDSTGRWPTNVVLDDTQAAELDKQTGVLTSGANPTRRGSDKFRNAYGDFAGQEECTPARGTDSGGASRFFPTFRYEAKAPTAERPVTDDGTAHPTVKPLDLMRWLVRLVTPRGGLVLDPFLGSGTTAEACVIEGFRCIGIERDTTYLSLIVERLSKPIQPDMFGGVA